LATTVHIKDDPTVQSQLVILGFGYVAGFLVGRLRQGWPEMGVVGTRRHSGGGDADVMIHAYHAGQYALPPALLAALQDATHLLITLPPDQDGCPAARDLVAQLGEGAPLMPQLRWLGYCSATNVYGDHQGDWVDEDSACLAVAGSLGARRLVAEQQWAQLAQSMGWPAPYRFRLAGIYGPGRSVLNRLIDGQPLTAFANTMPVSRIHVADIAQLIAASMASPPEHTAGRIYNLSDQDPAPSVELLRYAAGLLKIPLPEDLAEDSATPHNPAPNPVGRDRKRVDGRRILQDLERPLCYPTYRQGLQAIAATLLPSQPI
jgi:uncharacterized protein YbjT (DUF2867 family)